MPRLAPLDLDKLTPEQKKAADAIVAGPRGGLRGPFEPWLRRPQLADRAQKLGEYCRFNNSLPQRPRGAGDLPGRPALQGAVRVLRPCPARQGSRASRPRSSRRCAPAQRRLSRATSSASSTTSSPSISRPTGSSTPNYKRAVDAFGEPGVVDLVGVCGYYMLVSMTLNVFEMPLPPGEPEPLA